MLTFQARHTPVSGLHFWTALSLASILGCNTGDYFASFFGFLSGLPALVVAFAIIAALEHRDRSSTIAWYWLAIIVVRTAATNLADFVAHQTGMTYALVALTALLVAALALARARRRGAPAPTANGLPVVDGLYWFTMLTAGTLGTALGDFISFKSGLGLGGASLVLSACVVLLVAGRTNAATGWPIPYWLLVVLIRTAGTSVGDWFARQLGLWQSTAVFAVLLLAFLWRGARRAAVSPT